MSFAVWNFGGNNLGKGYEWNANMNLKNFWSAWTGGNLQRAGYPTGMLRGGPMMKMPGDVSIRLGFSSDSRKEIRLQLLFQL